MLWKGKSSKETASVRRIASGRRRKLRRSCWVSLSPGQKVSVFYNPADPQQSMLKPGAGFSEYALLGVPVVSLILGLVTFYIVSRSRKKAAAGLTAAR